MSHRMGSLLPPDGRAPLFAQIYILDGSDQDAVRGQGTAAVLHQYLMYLVIWNAAFLRWVGPHGVVGITSNDGDVQPVCQAF